MDKNLTLVIMAAGKGSRFGGLKQVEEMGPNGEFILDYSIYDSILAGFTKVVFIIRREHFDIFKNSIGKRIENKINVSYVFQEFDQLKEKYNIPEEREKPLGTAHAILCSKSEVNTPFAIINADDFYGRDAFMKAGEFLKNMDDNSNSYGMVAYKTGNTLTDNGSVKRGVCETNDKYLSKIIESKIEKVDDKIVASPLSGEPSFEVSEDSVVSMNMFLFSPTIFNYIESGLDEFFEVNKDNMLDSEYLMPDVLEENMNNKNITIEVVPTSAKWYGITYKEDKEEVVNAIKNMVDSNIYPNDLWK